MKDTNLGQLFLYGLTAGTAAVVDIGGFALLFRLGAPVAVSATLSFCAAAVVNYTLTTRFVFGSRASARRFGLFMAFALVGLAINVGVTVLLANRFDVLPELAKIGGVGVAFFANFAMNKWIVFRAPPVSQA